MHHVLVGIDGSEWSEIAARYAHDFASGTEHDIQAVAVLPAKVIETLSEPPQELAYSSIVLDEAEDMGRRAVNDWFQATDEMCEEHDICFVRNIEVGDPVEELTRMSLGAHLTVLGSRGANADSGDKKLGHIARSVMDTTRKPIMITGPEY
ncbi:MAG: universal stress protein, partial [Armatimonadota bacterium]